MKNVNSVIQEIQSYITYNWKKNHILSKNRKLFLWQHSYKKKKIDFILKKKSKKLVAILGIINQSRNNNFSEISLAIWHSLDKISGIILMLKAIRSKKINVIKVTTIGPQVLSIYKSLNFKIFYFNKYYLNFRIIRDQKITKNLKVFKFFNLKENYNLNIKNINQINIFKKYIKNYKYIQWRFINHPIFKYYFCASKDKKLILIFRILKVDNRKFLRIVDFIGSFKNQINFIYSFANIVKKRNFDYIEFLHVGNEDSNIKKSGFNQIKKKQIKKSNSEILPLYHSPYLGIKKQDILCGILEKSSKNNKIKLVRADGDCDRPS